MWENHCGATSVHFVHEGGGTTIFFIGTTAGTSCVFVVSDDSVFPFDVAGLGLGGDIGVAVTFARPS